MPLSGECITGIAQEVNKYLDEALFVAFSTEVVRAFVEKLDALVAVPSDSRWMASSTQRLMLVSVWGFADPVLASARKVHE